MKFNFRLLSIPFVVYGVLLLILTPTYAIVSFLHSQDIDLTVWVYFSCVLTQGLMIFLLSNSNSLKYYIKIITKSETKQEEATHS